MAVKEQFVRTALALGEDAVESLGHKRVAIFGVGGVGGYVVEALARSGIGEFDLIDNDEVAMSNLNRQIIATLDTVGRKKVDVMKERILSIHQDAIVHCYETFVLPENIDTFPFGEYDYVVDALDTVAAKIAIIQKATEYSKPVISSMGAGNKLDPTKFEVADIYKTDVCPLAKVMRRELKKRNIPACKVVFSREKSNAPKMELPKQEMEASKKRAIPASVAFVPSVVGLIIAGEVLKDLIQ